MYDLNEKCRSKDANLNGQKLQYFIKNPQSMSSISAVRRKSVHSLHFLINCSRLLFITHLLPLIFRLSANSSVHRLAQCTAAPKMFS